MSYSFCPLFKTCRMVNNRIIVSDNTIRENYIRTYCKCKVESWENCKRYKTRNELNFCPDFVLPDSKMSVAEIIERFDAEEIS